MEVTLQRIEEAAEKLKGVVKNTPLELSKRLSEQYHANIYLKREDLQEVRSFKIRGAYNKIASLTDDEKINYKEYSILLKNKFNYSYKILNVRKIYKSQYFRITSKLKELGAIRGQLINVDYDVFINLLN